MDYEILFDGSHGNADWDLLCCPPVREKRAAPAVLPGTQGRVPVKHGALGPIASAVLACLQDGPLSRRQLRALTGFVDQSLANALYRLQRDGWIQASANATGKDGRPGRTYRLRGTT